MSETTVDVLLVGAGVMSATLGMLLRQLDPAFRIVMVERLDEVAQESTDGWNNAGTGHAGYCELNYTPQSADGSIEIGRALSINAAFEVSLQLWSWLVEQNALPAPRTFINPTPHQSFVWGEADVAFLRQRFERLNRHHLFKDMEYSEDLRVLGTWMPLVMRQRDASQAVAATRVSYGSDVDFGTLTRSMVKSLEQHPNFTLMLGHAVKALKQQADGQWNVRIEDRQTGKLKTINAGFVFLGAGGGALPLLQKSGIPESKGYGGFPVSGQWLVCKNPDIVRQHRAKVYGKAPVGAPPMSVPHLDTRIIGGEPALLFGPYAGFTTRFSKQGSPLDLLASVKPNNLKSMLGAGLHNIDLTRYLIGEVFQSHKERVDVLSNFYPEANMDDWTLATAGQRVQIIKKCGQKGGKLEFGTEIVASEDGSLAALLGASPGASVSVQAMINVIERCFKNRMHHGDWQAKLKEMVPSYGESLVEDAELLQAVRKRTLATLGLNQA
ncbi:MAG TPA: malate dehydrogenase (quinone) [Novimethylophilus sp.]|jgi:malate dehydrogenase (quinone)|uniref:malate dehydrogenase (quinone) n=1 Tax=Novimethylophilus sp. TaxID=2137426 RepID=UPI002F40958E